MANKVRVYGKAQNATALGIVNAYLVMYPHATLDDLKQAFPDSINPDSGVKKIFRTKDEIEAEIKAGTEWYTKGMAYFTKDGEWLQLADGTVAAVVRMWTKPSFERMVAQAGVYDIEIAAFEKVARGEKGEFRLEYLNGYVPPVPGKKKMPAWLWGAIAAGVALLAVAAFLLGGSGKETVEVEKIVEVHDTVYVQQLEEIETNFNAAKFEQGKYDLNDDAKFVLHDLAKLLEKNPDLKLKIEGHTSAEGDAAANKTLSENRAKATVDFLVSQGVDKARLQYEGCGSDKLKNTENPMAEENRRTEFVVIK